MEILAYLLVGLVLGLVVSQFYDPEKNNLPKVLAVTFAVLIIGIFASGSKDGGIASERLIGLSVFYTFIAYLVCSIKNAIKSK